MLKETLGVPVLSYAKTKDFPNFFSPRSGFKVGYQCVCINYYLQRWRPTVCME
jgi:pseudouridine-5'-phosphate glycosidase